MNFFFFRYILHHILVMTNDTIFGVFQEPPNIGKIQEVNQLQYNDNVSLARWDQPLS